ncbi:hypothetical protein, partial [Erwinia amylovora]|uniref:hypothetical protein n=1 Tax=Erwinia amylovora TaxID=552 RepID=UPI0020C02726
RDDAITVFNSIKAITPICGAETPPTMDDVIRQTLLTSVAALQSAAFRVAAEKAAALKTTGEPQ